ncbi:MAG: TRAP transporter substrate-binding protein [Pseudomonadota bacterium]
MITRLISTATAALASAGMMAGAALAQTELTYSSWIPWSHPVNVNIYIPWMEAIEKESEGRITFKRLPKPVASPPAHLDAVRTGQADVAFSVHGYSRKQFAAYLFAELPFLGDSAELTSIALMRTHDAFLADKNLYPGVHLIGMNMHGPGVVHHSERHILTPADMEGQKMRTGGPIPLAIVEAWGGVSIRQPAPKSYEILSSGIADGILFPFESLPSFKITDLVPYSTTMPGGWYSSSHYLVMNQAKYDALAPEDKAIIDKYSGEAFAKLAGQGWDTINEWGLGVATDAGNTIVAASPELEAELKALNEGFIQAYLEAAEAEGVDGQAMLDFFMAEMAKLGS